MKEDNVLSKLYFSFDEDLVLIKDNSKSSEEVITKLTLLLTKKGLVKESFLQSVLDREKTFPTGLVCNGGGVAIPHTTTEHVIQPAIAVATLEKSIPFEAMDGHEKSVNVDVVFMFTVKHPNAQLEMLKSLILLIQDEDSLMRLQNAKCRKEIIEIVRNSYSKEEQHV